MEGLKLEILMWGLYIFRRVTFLRVFSGGNWLLLIIDFNLSISKGEFKAVITFGQIFGNNITLSPITLCSKTEAIVFKSLFSKLVISLRLKGLVMDENDKIGICMKLCFSRSCKNSENLIK